MKMNIALVFCLVFGSLTSQADFSTFLKSCGYGTLIGVGVGLASLALENKPSEHYGSVARGASLGLYGGIAYGIYQNNPPQQRLRHDYDMDGVSVFVPKFQQARLDGIELNALVYSF